MGLDIVADSVREAFPGWTVAPVDESSAREVDYLLVSLYWWRDCYALPGFLARAGIDPRKRAPVILIGGMMAVNPRPLTGYFHVAIVGDGEDVIGPVLAAIEAGDDPRGMTGVWTPDGCRAGFAVHLPAKSYSEIRTTRVTRIEIARGCKLKCAFCQLSAMKPYREASLAVIRELILRAPTKAVALFAPDRGSHSRADEIDAIVKKLGKRNSGSDVRLTTIGAVTKANAVRFGIEAFSAAGRKAIRKPCPDDLLLKRLTHLSHAITTMKGKPLSSATAYVIADLPVESTESVADLWRVLQRWDDALERQFTLFLSTSSFCPSPFTTLERSGIHPYSDFNERFSVTRPRFKRLIIATRGGLIGPGQRIAQMLAVRGDESCRRALYHIATKEAKLLSDASEDAGRRVEKIVRSAGYDPRRLWGEWPADEPMPWSGISLGTAR